FASENVNGTVPTPVPSTSITGCDPVWSVSTPTSPVCSELTVNVPLVIPSRASLPVLNTMESPNPTSSAGVPKRPRPVSSGVPRFFKSKLLGVIPTNPPTLRSRPLTIKSSTDLPELVLLQVNGTPACVQFERSKITLPASDGTAGIHDKNRPARTIAP